MAMGRITRAANALFGDSALSTDTAETVAMLQSQHSPGPTNRIPVRLGMAQLTVPDLTAAHLQHVLGSILVTKLPVR